MKNCLARLRRGEKSSFVIFGHDYFVHITINNRYIPISIITTGAVEILLQKYKDFYQVLECRKLF